MTAMLDERRRCRARTDTATRVPAVAVGDGVVDEVARSRSSRAAAVAADLAAVVARTTASSMSLVLGGQPGLRSTASRAQVATSTRRGSRSASAPCSRDRSTISLTRRVSRSASTLHPLGEPAHGLGVVVRVEHRLGEQGHAADRGLELVADVGDEVAADLLDPARLGAVLDEEQHVVRPERRDAGARRRAGPGPSGPCGSSSSTSRITPSRRTCSGEVEQLGVRRARARGRGRGRTRPGESLTTWSARVDHDRRSSAAPRGRRRRRRRQGWARQRRRCVIGCCALGEAHGDERPRRPGRGRRCHPALPPSSRSTRLSVRAPAGHAPTTWAPSVHAATDCSPAAPPTVQRCGCDSRARRGAPADRQEDHARRVPRGPRHDLRPARRDDPARGVGHLPGDHRPARRRPAPRRERHRGRRQARRHPRRARRAVHRPAGPPAAGRHRPAHRRHRDADERRPRADGRPRPARRQGRAAALPRLGGAADAARPHPADGPGRRARSSPRRLGHRRAGRRGRARARAGRRRRWTSCTGSCSPPCSTRTDLAAPQTPST